MGHNHVNRNISKLKMQFIRGTNGHGVYLHVAGSTFSAPRGNRLQ